MIVYDFSFSKPNKKCVLMSLGILTVIALIGGAITFIFVYQFRKRAAELTTHSRYRWLFFGEIIRLWNNNFRIDQKWIFLFLILLIFLATTTNIANSRRTTTTITTVTTTSTTSGKLNFIRKISEKISWTMPFDSYRNFNYIANNNNNNNRTSFSFTD